MQAFRLSMGAWIRLSKGQTTVGTFIAIKGTPVELQTFPEIVAQNSDWQEGELSYANESRLKKRLKWQLEDWLDRMGLLRWCRPTLKRTNPMNLRKSELFMSGSSLDAMPICADNNNSHYWSLFVKNPNDKDQISNKSQIPMTKFEFGISSFGGFNLFEFVFCVL